MMTRTLFWNGNITERQTLVRLIEWQITHYARLRTGHFVVWSEYPPEANQRNEESEQYAWVITELPTDVRNILEEVGGELPFAVRLALVA